MDTEDSSTITCYKGHTYTELTLCPECLADWIEQGGTLD